MMCNFNSHFVLELQSHVLGNCMLIHGFSSNWVDILVYLLDTYLEQIVIVEGTEEPCDGKIKDTTKDLNYDVNSALNIVSCCGLRKRLVPGNVKSLMFVA